MNGIRCSNNGRIHGLGNCKAQGFANGVSGRKRRDIVFELGQTRPIFDMIRAPGLA